MRRVTILAICLFLKKNSEANMAKYIRLLYLTKKIKRQTNMLLYLDVYNFLICVYFKYFLKVRNNALEAQRGIKERRKRKG